MKFSNNVFKFIFLVTCYSVFSSQIAFAEDKATEPSNKNWDFMSDTPTWLSLHGQYTNTTQYHSSFNAASSGPNSMLSTSSTKNTNDLTLFLGVSLWEGAGIFYNPEIDQGYGLSNTLGLAGFSSGEAYKIGAGSPYLKIPRYFFRQTINLGGESTKLDEGFNQMTRTADNLIITAGKFSVVDVFDTNTYAHDPRGDFLNWSILESGAFDYAADAWGYTYGGALELTKDWWTARAGIFALSVIPNQPLIDSSFHDYETVVELEERHQLWSQPGKFKILMFTNHANMGSYSTAVAEIGAGPNAVPNTALVRSYATKMGVALNTEQAITDHIGWFGRLSLNDGSKEAYDFTDINRSVATGLLVDGNLWGRPKDKIGIAFVENQLGSSSAKSYFELGGLGTLIGDGKHSGYAPEQIIETFYSMQVEKHITVSLDYQWANNPAYNPARGPINILGLRMHAEF